MTQILEGTWEQVKTHDAELAGRRVRLIVDPDEEEIAPASPETPYKIRSEQQLFALLREGDAGPFYDVTDKLWDEIRDEAGQTQPKREG
jgi:hypothetical protein